MRVNIKMGIIVVLLMAYSIANAQNNAGYSSIALTPDPLETISVETDRDIYLSGERIWLKAYCLNSTKSSASKLSKVLYVELFNGNSEVIIKQKFNIENGTVQGTIDIPMEFLSGNYYLMAYTQYLKNYPPQKYFTSMLTILNTEYPLPEKTIDISESQIELFPENGILIDSIQTKVAFKIDENLSHEIKEILIQDEEGKIVANPINIKSDLGLFELIPYKSKNYFFKIILHNSDSIIKSLPTVFIEGIAIKPFFSDNNELKVEIINKQTSSVKQSEQNYLLEIISQDKQILSKTKIILKDRTTNMLFPASILNSGINYLYLKNQSGIVVQTHAFYYHDDIGISFDFSHPNQVYAPRELVKLNLNPSTLNKNISANLSVSVIKKGTYQQFPSNIFSNRQLLNSYCQNNNISLLSTEEKEYLMILYNYQLLSKSIKPEQGNVPNQFIEWIPEIRNVSLSGTIIDKTTKLPKANISVYLSAFNKNPQIHVSTSRQNGEFIFSLNNLEDNQDIFLCPKADKDDKLELKINNDFTLYFPETSNIPLSINTSHKNLVKEMNVNRQTNNIYGIETAAKQKPKNIYPLNIKESQSTILLADYIDTKSLETVFKELIPFCSVRKSKDEYSLLIINNIHSFYSEDPLILIDNIPVFNVNELLKIPPAKIEKIELNYALVMLGDNIFQGIIRLTTNTDNFGGMKMPEGSTFLKYQTISPSYVFDPPIYNSEEKRLSKLADFRTLLYWNPNVELNKDTSVSFYTSDHCSEYEVIVRGITKDGKNCYGRTSFNVVAK
ncbi:MAG: hypothetical protein CVU00_11755 [Bacteroidetes bacterium HGW-Bacteroidetes-17]|jgi:hypothetical protein|nr:MAG: hypothetical protein CVU00_11755 [Bacteroidetes bacterium HGW-Bacteroidetes-17]